MGQIPMDWKFLPEFPTHEEILSPRPKPIPVNPIDGRHRQKEEYLEAHYRVLRHEAMEPLRKAVCDYKSKANTSQEECFIYDQGFLQGYTFAHSGVLARFYFTSNRLTVQPEWDQSERLIPGALVALSSDDFDSECIMAVVAERVPEANSQLEANPCSVHRHTIELEWACCSDAVFDASKKMVMIESPGGYFESVRHTMLGLQRAYSSPSRFDKYFVDGVKEDRSIEKPSPIAKRKTDDLELAALLDESQREAFRRMTTSELAIVQGPPGTGKTFTSVAALQSLVLTPRDLQTEDPYRERSPVIVAAQTNHALDQLLDICIRQQIGTIARLGGRTSSERVNKRTIYRLCKQSKLPLRLDSVDKARKEKARQLAELLAIAYPARLISAQSLYMEKLITFQQYQSLLQPEDDWESASEAREPMESWLGFSEKESDRTHRDATIPDTASLSDAGIESEEDLRYSDKDFIPVARNLRRDTRNYTGFNEDDAWQHQAEHHLAHTTDLHSLKPSVRKAIYHYLDKRFVERCTSRFRDLLGDYEQLVRVAKQNRNQYRVEVLRDEGVTILGCTTTGLTKYWDILAAFSPHVLMIEEAAETREANITSALFQSLKQIILVGDHQQLRPQVDTRMLAFPLFNLNISLFERLVKLGLPYSALTVQRRMRPEIRQVVNTLYPLLTDHRFVKSLPAVPGMKSNLWWFQHSWPESRIAKSFTNKSEAEMIVGLVQHLVSTGTEPSSITVLSYYSEQVKLIQDKLRRCQRLESAYPLQEWSVSTIDGFQGEENDVVILSLVRSPTNSLRASVGFVNSENRATVALSRARRGLYILGNALNLLQADPRSIQTWRKVYDIFTKNNRTSFKLPVTCPVHGGHVQVGHPQDWRRLIVGDSCRQSCVGSIRGLQNHRIKTQTTGKSDGTQSKATHSDTEYAERGGLQFHEVNLIYDGDSCPKRSGKFPESNGVDRGGLKPFKRELASLSFIRTSDDLMNDGYFRAISYDKGQPDIATTSEDITEQASCEDLLDMDYENKAQSSTLDNGVDSADLISFDDPSIQDGTG